MVRSAFLPCKRPQVERPLGSAKKLILMLLTLMCVSHSRGATYQINGAREVQGERRAEVRSSYAEPQPSLAVHFPLNALQRYK